MDWNIIEARWHEYRAGAKQQWNKLSEQQLRGTTGRRDYILRRVQEAYSLTAQEAEQQVAAWQARQFDRLAPAANG
jgi:uncharacterized protein YjbJ (UPF0337 family)